MSLKTILQKHLLDHMIKKCRSNQNEHVALVVDAHTTKILSSCCRMYDLVEAGVLVLENLDLPRERLDFAAIYFISNTASSISKVIQDFAGKKPQYPSVHLFFTGAVTSAHMKMIGGAKNLVARIKTFEEINVDFIANESHLFTFGQKPNILANLYSPDRDVLATELQKASSQLVSVLLTLKEFPHIRFAKNGICKGFADFVEADMKQKIAQLKTWEQAPGRERGTLIILDRSIDPVSPIMHEYTYQAMCNDLLKIRGELCTLPDEVKAESKQDGDDILVLSEDDNLWLDFRHEHIGRVLSDVTNKFKEFKQTNNMAKLQGAQQQGENASVKDMIAAMKAMPKYKDMMRKYHKHVSLAEACMNKFDRKRLKELGELEQDMATGFTDEGNAVQPNVIKRTLVDMIKAEDIGVLDKLRLLMVYLSSQGAIQESTRKELVRGIDVRLQKAITGLTKLGVDLATSKQKSKPKHSKARLADFQKRAKTIPMALMRYVPFLHQVVSDAVAFSLDDTEYPYTSPPPANHKKGGGKVRSARQPRVWRGGKDAATETDNRPLFIVFVLGGLTFSELRSIYEIGEQQKANIYVGSTNTLVASEFIQGLAGLSTKQFITAVKASHGVNDPDELPDAKKGDDEEDEGASSDSD